MPTISPTCIRLNQWRKQGYLDQKFKDFYEVTKNAIGLHSTDYWTPYLSVWSRIGDYDAKSVFEALNTGKRIVRSRAFRNTQHVVLIEDFVLITRALGPQLERSMIPAPPIKKLEEPEREKLLNELLSAFEEGPMTMQGLKQALPHVGEMMRWLLLILMGRGQVIRTSATHARSTIQMYDLTARWLPRFSLTDISEEDARAEILFKYIVSFGPVTLEDISWWLPCKKTEAKSHIESLDEKLIVVKMDGHTAYMSSDDYEMATSIDESVRPGITLTPYEDFFPKAYSHRHWYLSSQMKEIVFPRRPEHYWPPEMKPPPPGPPKGMNASGEMRPSIWVNGKVAGRWEIERDGHVSFGLVSKVSPDERMELEEKRDSLEEFLQSRLMPISQ